MQTGHRGFSLVELLIVVAVIMIIAAIAIPDFMRSKIAANQASAVASCRVIDSSEATYRSTYSQGYSSSLAALGPPPAGTPEGPSNANLIDATLASGVKSGYSLTYTPANPDASGHYLAFTINANPILVGNTGNTYYYSDQTYVIRQNTGGPATASDTPVGR